MINKKHQWLSLQLNLKKKQARELLTGIEETKACLTYHITNNKYGDYEDYCKINYYNNQISTLRSNLKSVVEEIKIIKQLIKENNA